MADAADRAGDLIQESVRATVGNIVRRVGQESGSAHCHSCEDEIPERRRQIAPWAKHCVPCLEKIEKK